VNNDSLLGFFLFLCARRCSCLRLTIFVAFQARYLPSYLLLLLLFNGPRFKHARKSVFTYIRRGAITVSRTVANVTRNYNTTTPTDNKGRNRNKQWTGGRVIFEFPSGWVRFLIKIIYCSGVGWEGWFYDSRGWIGLRLYLKTERITAIIIDGTRQRQIILNRASFDCI